MRKWMLVLVSLSLVASLFAGGVQASQTYRFTVVFKSQTLPSNAAAIVATAGGRVLASVPEIGVMAVEGPAALMGALNNHREVAAVSPSITFTAEPRQITEFEAAPASVDMAAADLHNLNQWDIKQVTANGASYGLHTGSHSTVVGIIDTGINTGHADLMANYMGGRNFTPDGPGDSVDPADVEDRHGHGSHVAGAIAGNGRVLGVGPDLGYRSYRVFGATGGSPSSRIAQAIVAAANDGVDVISMSLGGYDVLGWGYWTAPDGTVYRFKDVADFVASKRAVQYAVKHGVVVVASAGNDAMNIANPHGLVSLLNSQYGPYGYYFQGAARETPGTLPGVVAVSATGPDTSLASYSNYGPGAIDVSAPGGDFLRWPEGDWWTDMCFSAYMATDAGPNRYAWMAGTSMSAPKVSAVAALIKDQAKADGRVLSPAQVVVRMQKTATDLGKPGYDPFYGQGMVNAYAALGGN